MKSQIKLSKEIKNQIFILNQIFEIENKLSKINITHTINRNIEKLKYFYENDFDEEISFVIENPIGQSYDVTRTDIEANIVGDSVDNLVIIDVIKPIIRIKIKKITQVVQKGIVIVQEKTQLNNQKIKQKIKKKNYQL
jgi:hypothetical protein